MSSVYKVYISSTSSDLKNEREAAAKAVRTPGLQATVMEDYTSTEHKLVDKCLAEVSSCDIYIGIYAFRYGFIPDGYDKSITHLEYEEAGKAEIHRLIFLIDDDAPEPPLNIDKNRENIDKFREIVKKDHIVTILSDVNRLPFKISPALKHTIDELEKNGKSKSLLKSKIPLILPYLNDQTNQKEELDEVLSGCQDNLHRKPLVCIIHGDVRERHGKFIEKIQHYLLPDLLCLPLNKIWITR